MVMVFYSVPRINMSLHHEVKKIQKFKIRLVWKSLVFFFLCKVTLPLQASTGKVTHFFLHPTLLLFSCDEKQMLNTSNA
jgi:hypothetical protein